MVRVEVARASEFGSSDRTFIVNTFLGEFLNFNDTVLGYDLAQMTMSELEEYTNDNKLNRHELPDVVLVRKSYPKVRKRQNTRIWKLNHLEKESVNENNIWKGKDKRASKQDAMQERAHINDYNTFLEDIEEDPEMRQNINLYKDDNILEALEKQLGGLTINEETTPASSKNETEDKSQKE